jgi:hypothetical protein
MSLRHIQTVPSTLQLSDRPQAPLLLFSRHLRVASTVSRIWRTSENILCRRRDVYDARALIAGGHKAVDGWRQ